MLKKLLKITTIVVIILMMITVGLFIAVQQPRVQTYITQKVTETLSEQLGAKVSIDRVNIKFFRRVILEEVYIEDLQQDTLLYAQQVNLGISAFQPLKNRVSLKEAELNNFRINLYRLQKDSVFNYQFIADHISSTEQTEPGSIWQVDFERLSTTALDFSYRDEKTLQEFIVKLDGIDLINDELNLSNKQIGLKEIRLDNAQILVHMLEGTKQVKIDSTLAGTPVDLAINQQCWDLSSEKVIVQGSTFHYLNDRQEKTAKGIDYNDLYISDINVNLENTVVNLDTLHSNIISLSCKEKSGFQINNLTANATVSPNLVECTNIHLQTPNSDITDYFSMKYNTFYDFNDFVQKVYMTGEFDKAKVSFKDINYFAKALDNIEHNTVQLTGKVRGTVNNLKGRDLLLQAGNRTNFMGDISLRGLPKFKETFISLNVDRLLTNIEDAHRIYPHFKYPPALTEMGRSRFSGHFDGFFFDFVANGELVSQLGEVDADLNFKIDNNSGLASYKGNFAANELDIGQWLGQPELIGKITLNTKVNGKGLKVSNALLNMEGKIERLVLNGHDYQGVKVDGNLEQGMFEGSLTVKDDNLDMDFVGTVDLKPELPIFNFSADLRFAKLKELNFSDKDMILSSDMELDIQGDNIDNLVGYAAVYNTKFLAEEDTFYLDTLILDSKEVVNGKHLTLSSDILDGEVKGNFTFEELPQALKKMFKDYFQTEGVAEESEFDTLSQQSFDYSIKIKDTRNITQLLHPDVKNVQYASFDGFFDNQKNKLVLIADIEGITYQNLTFRQIAISSSTSSDNIELSTSIDTLLLGDSLLTEEIILSGNIQNDKALFNFKIQDEESPERLDLYGDLKTDLQSITLNLLPRSTFHLNNERWGFNGNNHIHYTKDSLSVKWLDMTDGKHEISINSFEDKFNNSNLGIRLNQITLKEVTPSFATFTGVTIDGLINGEVAVLDVLNDPAVIASITVDSFKVNEDTWGNIVINSSLLDKQQKVSIDASIGGHGNIATAKGYYTLRKEEDNLNVKVDIENFNLPLIEVFLDQLISNTEGTVSGQLALTGTVTKPVLDGDLLAANVRTRVNYLNTYYHFNDESIYFRKNIIDFDEITLYDANKQKGILTGSITHSYFADPMLEVLIQIDESQRFQLLNTNFAQGEAFYGNAYGHGLVLIDGDFNNLQLYASLTSGKETDVSIPVADSKEVGQYEFYQFINTDTDKKEVVYKPSRSPLSLTIDMKVTKDAEVKLILSQEDGDVIKSIGDANLKVKVNNYGDIEVQGAYYVNDGDYVFRLQNIVSKKFEMEQGSSILWSGDPYDAKLDIKAVYRLRAAPYDLIEDVVKGNEPVAASKSRIPVYLYLLIRGSLLNPDISFDIKIPETDPAIKNAVDSKMQLIRTDQNELNKQVVGLLVLNRFVPIYPVGNPNNTIVEGVNNTVSEFVSNQLSIYLSDWISNFITEVELDINYRSYQNELEVVDGVEDEDAFENRRELQVALTKSFFNERVEVDVGGNFDFGQQQETVDGEEQTSTANNIAGDFEIRYSITADGRIKVKVFRKGDYDVFEERTTNKTGVGISYQREFDNVKDLFEFLIRRREKKTQKELEKEKEQEEDEAQPEAEGDTEQVPD